MDHQPHNVLDGARTRDELTPAELDELAALEATIALVTSPLLTAPVPDLTARVMAQVAAVRPAVRPGARIAAAVRGALAWIWAPRPLTLRLRPAYALGFGGVLSVLLLLAYSNGPARPEWGLSAELPAAHSAPQVYVQFRLEAHGAARVALAGTFTGWQPEFELQETVPGTWSILVPLQPGIHDYAFVVNGSEWQADPHALQIDDGFGGANSRIALPAPPMGSQRI
jgi:hypothetical protein